MMRKFQALRECRGLVRQALNCLSMLSLFHVTAQHAAQLEDWLPAGCDLYLVGVEECHYTPRPSHSTVEMWRTKYGGKWGT